MTQKPPKKRLKRLANGSPLRSPSRDVCLGRGDDVRDSRPSMPVFLFSRLQLKLYQEATETAALLATSKDEQEGQGGIAVLGVVLERTSRWLRMAAFRQMTVESRMQWFASATPYVSPGDPDKLQ